MPGNAAQPMIRLRIVDLGRPRQVQFQRADLLVVGVDEGQVGGDGTTHRRIVEALGDVEFLAVGASFT